MAKSLAEITFATKTRILRSAADLSWAPAVDYVEGLRSSLRHTIDRLPHDNFLVKPARKWVDRFAEDRTWAGLTGEDFDALEHDLARLASIGALPDTEEAKRFDCTMYQAQLAALTAPTALAGFRRRIQSVAAALQDQPNVPAIAAQLPLLAMILDDGEWESVSPEWLESIRVQLRELVHLIEKRKRTVVYSNFEDELGELEELELAGATNGYMDFSRYRDKTRLYLADYQDHTTIQRLRRNRQLTDQDLEELGRIPAQSGVGTPVDLERAGTDGLGLFVRSLVGLDREAVEEALAEFISDTALTASQLDFLQLLVNQLTENGVVKPDALFKSPYSELAPSGPDELFGEERAVRLIRTLRAIENNARVG